MCERRRFLRHSILAAGGLLLPPTEPPAFARAPFGGPSLPLVPDVELASLRIQARRLLAAAPALGLSSDSVMWAPSARRELGAEALQRELDRSCLVGVHINPETRVKVARGPAPAALVAHEWRPFLVKVHNEAGTTAALRAASPQAHAPGASPDSRLADCWLDLAMFDDPPLARTLGGGELEYRIVRLRSRTAGWREASLAFDVGQGTQDLGFRNEAPILFHCELARGRRRAEPATDGS